MVRYFDVIKGIGTKDEEPDRSKKRKKPEKPEDKTSSVRFSGMQDHEVAIDEGVDVSATEYGIEKTGETSLAINNCIKQVRAKVVGSEPFEIEPAALIIDEIIGKPGLIKEIYQTFVNLDYDEDYLISRLPNILSCVLIIGQSMGYSKGELLELGLSALLYDVGMFLVPKEIIEKVGRLNDYEVSLIRKHTETGRDTLTPLKEKYPWLHRVAYQHHERENGQGYPRGVKGREICEYAKIVGLVDSYDAMIHNRPHRKAMMQHKSIKELIGSKENLFSPKIIKVFIKEISLYPTGSYVRLNTKATGVVVDTNITNPMRPVVKIILDSNGDEVKKPIEVDLEKNQLHYIVDSIPREEIRPGVNHQ